MSAKHRAVDDQSGGQPKLKGVVLQSSRRSRLAQRGGTRANDGQNQMFCHFHIPSPLAFSAEETPNAIIWPELLPQPRWRWGLSRSPPGACPPDSLQLFLVTLLSLSPSRSAVPP